MSIFTLFGQTVRIAVPYLFAAAGGVVAERAGIVSLTLEGFMLVGAFSSALTSWATGSPWLGIVGGAAGGLMFASLHALATVRFRADQIVSGIAINLMALGLTRFTLRLVFESASNSSRVAGFGGDAATSGVWSMVTNPLVVLGLIAIPFVGWLLSRTPFGLHVRAVGERPDAAASVGVPVARVRCAAVLISGVFAALGGAYLALDQHKFTDEMTAGRGFIALAAIIFGGWQPTRAGLACLLFASAETLQIHLQGTGVIPSQLVQTIPYVLTILALLGLVGSTAPPAALGVSDAR